MKINVLSGKKYNELLSEALKGSGHYLLLTKSECQFSELWMTNEYIPFEDAIVMMNPSLLNKAKRVLIKLREWILR